MIIRQKWLTALLFVIYSTVLIWIILFKMQFSLQDISTIRYVNVIPFDKPMVTNGKVNYSEMYLNALIFAPFGMYLAILKPKWSILTQLALIALVSLSFEVLQYIFMIGSSDSTDLLMNTVGGLLGIIFYKVTVTLAKTRAHSLLIGFALIGTLLFLAIATLLIMANI